MKPSKIKYWLIYADEEGRQCQPFWDLETMENYIKRNDIDVLAKTKVIDGEGKVNE